MHSKQIIQGSSVLFLLFAGFLSVSYANDSIQTPKTSYNLRVMGIRFEKWMNKNNKVYKDIKEREERFAIYKSNVDFINHVNSQNLSFTLVDNEFADMTSDEFKSKFTGRLSSVVPSDGYDEEINTTAYNALPQTVDWRKQGSCWAFTTVATVEGYHKIKTGKLLSLSEQQLVDCARGGINRGCNGGSLELAFKYVQSKGSVLEKDYPYKGRDGVCNQAKVSKKAVTIKGYKPVPRNNEQALQAAVAKQPVGVALESNLFLQLYRGGIFTGFCGTNLNHGGTVIGYGEQRGNKYWLLKNSWGTNWGEKGFIRMKRNVASKSGLCGLAKQPCYPI
ncbi:hypothetical protein RND81_11G107100 [Saponaria officinalis]|uniref:Uncharacterized protein n=1 Tax=Saponaria officinalis TaxID=3572 RepID=A0AAW1HKS4_SAPOF